MGIKWILFIAVLMVACSPKTRFDRLVKKHPTLLPKDTIHDTVSVPVFVYIDSSKYKDANKDFDNSIDSASKDTKELQKKEPCAELANKVQKSIAGAKNAKQRIDTIYRQAECRIEPYFRSDSNAIISAKVVNGRIIVDYKFNQMKYTPPSEKGWFEYWQTIVVLVLLGLALLALIFKR
jgi:hypothetical protein